MLSKVKKIYTEYRYRERRYINNPDSDIYYIIRRKPLGEGFFSNYFYVLSHIIYADKHGWKSVVDMQNYRTLYSQENGFEGVKNAWECYFRQPDEVHVEEAYKSNNYVLSKNQYYGQLGVPVYSINQGHITEKMVKKLFPLQQTRIPVVHSLDAEASNLFFELTEANKCIGVHVRGTDMNIARSSHTIPPQMSDIFHSVDSILNTDDCRIFLCSDEERSISRFKKRYGKRVVTLEAYRSVGDKSVGVHKQYSNRKNHNYLLGREVLLDALMLSKCNYLICGISNVTSAAVLFNNLNYEKTIIIK